MSSHDSSDPSQPPADFNPFQAPDTPDVPAAEVDTLTKPLEVSTPVPDAIVTDPPKAVVPSQSACTLHWIGR